MVAIACDQPFAADVAKQSEELQCISGFRIVGDWMRVFWNDDGRGPSSDSASEVDLIQAGLIWFDEIRGMEGNFLGLIDDEGRVIQFYFDADIPDDVDDANHLKIVLMDFPQRNRKGSFNAHVTIGEVHSLIEKAFKVGADHRQFGELTFVSY